MSGLFGRSIVRRVGILGDVHLDLEGLDATLDGDLLGCDDVWVLGDFLDRGPARPADVLNHLEQRAVRALAGNHELAYLGGPAYPGMREPDGLAVAARLRDMVIDGALPAATVVDDVLCVHAGVSRYFWELHLAEQCGDDVHAIAVALNRWFTRGVVAGDYSHAIFAALESPVPGPFWADARAIVAAGCPPFRQAVGHTKVETGGWKSSGNGALFPLERAGRSLGDPLGHLVVELDRPLRTMGRSGPDTDTIGPT